VRVEALKRSSVRIAFKIVCEGDGRLVAEGWGTLVGYDYDAGEAAPLPDYVAARLRTADAG
jgi:acyl-CoA thioester hydrolase